MARRQTTRDGPVYYTTHQAAKFLGVSLPTVVNWIRGGLLEAHRTPGGHRRISHNDLLCFARKNEYPLAPELLERGDGRSRVLVVDDDPEFAEMVREFLALQPGFEVEVAESGFQAGLIVARFKPDVILMDLMMPGMDGLEAHRMLRADRETRHIPVIAVTAYHDAEVQLQLEEQQFEGLVEKPVRLEDLLGMVRGQLSI